jgi:hypothetical protein
MLAQLPELVRDRVSEPEKASEVRPVADVLREIFRLPTTGRTPFSESERRCAMRMIAVRIRRSPISSTASRISRN